MTNTVYAYNSETQRYTMQWDGKDYQFTYSQELASVINAWDSNGKLIARSYKGLRSKLGVQPSSSKSQELVNLFKTLKTFS